MGGSHEGNGGANDRARHGGGNHMYGDPYAPANSMSSVVAQDSKLASDMHVNWDQLSPELMQQYSLEEGARAGHSVFEKWLPAAMIAAATWGIGSAAGGALAGTAGSAGAAGTAGAGGAALGSGGALTSLGSAAVGATSGGVGTLLNSGLTGAPLTAGSFGRGVLLGGLSGGIGSYGRDLSKYFTDQGLSNAFAHGIVNTGMGAFTGGVGGALSGRGFGAGAAGGALNSASNAVGGSIFNSGDTFPTSGTTDVSASQPSTYMADDSLNPIDTSWANSYYQGGGGGYNTPPQFSDPNGPGGASSPTGGWLPTDGSGNVYSGGGGSGGNWGSFFSKLLGSGGGGGGSQGGGYGDLLSHLFGLGANTGAGFLNSGAARGAANQYGQLTHFNPYGVNTASGSTQFKGNQASSTLSPQMQQMLSQLGGVTSSAAGDLSKGTQGNQDSMFKYLQDSQRDSNNKFYQSNLDSQFGNGVLSSTAGQYQSQAALDAINKQTTMNHLTAQTMAGNQQQQQLSQLTAGLGGMRGINQDQLMQLMYGGNLGADASNANRFAYDPMVHANSNSPWGQLLSSIGNQYNNGGG